MERGEQALSQIGPNSPKARSLVTEGKRRRLEFLQANGKAEPFRTSGGIAEK
jgi:hypothetical protein